MLNLTQMVMTGEPYNPATRHRDSDRTATIEEVNEEEEGEEQPEKKKEVILDS